MVALVGTMLCPLGDASTLKFRLRQAALDAPPPPRAPIYLVPFLQKDDRLDRKQRISKEDLMIADLSVVEEGMQASYCYVFFVCIPQHPSGGGETVGGFGRLKLPRWCWWAFRR